MKKYRISLDGCDDSTNMIMILSDKEYELVKRMSELSFEKSEYACMPTMEIDEIV